MAFRAPAASSEVENSINRGKEKLIVLYEMLQNHCLPEEIPGLLDSLRESMQTLILLESHSKDLKTTKQIVAHEFTEKINSEGGAMDVTLEQIKVHLNEKLESENSKHPEGFWERDPLLASMKNFDGMDEGEQEENNVDDGEELACTSQTIQTIDPYTKVQFSDPVKNRNCNHPYEKTTIEELLKTKARVRCYHMGCRVMVEAQDLVPDDELRRYLVRVKARAGGVANVANADMNAEYVS